MLIGSGLVDKPRFMANLGDDFAIEGTLAEDGERMKLVELVVAALGKDAEVTSSTLRDIELLKFVNAGRALVTESARFWTPEALAEVEERYGIEVQGPGPEVVRAARKRIKQAARRTPRSRGLGDDHYRRVALAAIELSERRVKPEGGILEALKVAESKRLGRDIPIETVRTWLKVARDRKFLAPGERGRASFFAGSELYAK